MLFDWLLVVVYWVYITDIYWYYFGLRQQTPSFTIANFTDGVYKRFGWQVFVETQSTEAHTDVRKTEISRIASVLKNNVVAPFFVSVLFLCALTSQFFYFD